MDPARWKRLRTLYDEIADLPPDEREAAARDACGNDEELAADLLKLFETASDAEAAVEGIVAGAASTLLEGSEGPLEGARVGPYRLVSEIGRGGMGAVYLAERADGQFEQRVALKLIKPGLATRTFLQRFRAERQILARLQHPHIARLLDGGVDDEGRPYFALEYVEGRPIDKYCDTHALDIDERLELFLDVCRAVAYAHANLVVHRDIKPANILVDGRGQVRLLDFGIAKVLREGDDEPGLTQIGMRVMTPEYASPEQVRGEAVGTATDVYSLGVVLYQLLTGAHPYEFTTVTPLEIERVVCETMPPRPSSKVRAAGAGRPAGAGRDDASSSGALPAGSAARFRRRLRGDLDVICLKALQKDPERRYTSVEAFQHDIRRNLTGQPVLAQPDSVAYRAGKFARRHRVGLGIAAAVLAGFVAFGGYHTVRLARERDRAQSEAAKAAQVASFLQDLFAVSDPSESRGETITARELLDSGADKIERDLAAQPEIRASMMRLIGNVYNALGLLSRAGPLLEQALDDHRRLFGDAHEETAQSQYDLAILRQDMNELDAAEELIRASLQTRRDLLGEQHPQTVESLLGLSYLLETRGDVEGAERTAREAVMLVREHLAADDPVALEAISELAGMLRRQQQVDEAEPLLRETLAAQRAVYGDEDLQVASTARNLASLLRDRGTPEALAEAESLYQEAIATRRKILGDSHPEVAVALNSYAMLLDRRDDLTGAIAQYRELLRILEQASGGRADTDMAAVTTNMAAALQRSGQLDEAAAVYARAIELADEALEAGHPNRAFAKIGLASVYIDQDRAAAAEPLIREALAIRSAGLPAGHRYIGDALIELGTCLFQQGRFEETEQVLLEARDLFRANLGEEDGRTRSAERRLETLYEAWER